MPTEKIIQAMKNAHSLLSSASHGSNSTYLVSRCSTEEISKVVQELNDAIVLLESEQLMSVQEAAAWLRCHEETLLRAVRMGRLPAVRTKNSKGGRVRLRRADLLRVFGSSPPLPEEDDLLVEQMYDPDFKQS